MAGKKAFKQAICNSVTFCKRSFDDIYMTEWIIICLHSSVEHQRTRTEQSCKVNLSCLPWKCFCLKDCNSYLITFYTLLTLGIFKLFFWINECIILYIISHTSTPYYLHKRCIWKGVWVFGGGGFWGFFVVCFCSVGFFLTFCTAKVKFQIMNILSPNNRILTLLEAGIFLLEIYNHCFSIIPSGCCYLSVYFICK